MVLNLPSPRVDWYESTDFDGLQKAVVKYVNQYVQTIGFYPVYT